MVILGVGAGTTAVFDGEASSSFAITTSDDNRPMLLADLGLGVVRAYAQHLQTDLPPYIYISHNHTDHAGELPVAAAVARRGAMTPTLLAHEDVLHRLIQYRLHELVSTGLPVDAFVAPHALREGHAYTLPGTPLSLEPVLAQHSERCFGLLVRWNGQPVMGWTADSGYSSDLYRTLLDFGAPLLLLDARQEGNAEHASIADVEAFAADAAARGVRVVVTGYGTAAQRPWGMKHCVAAVPGQRWSICCEESGLVTVCCSTTTTT